MISRVFEGDFNAARVIAGQLRDDLSGGFRSTIDSMTKAWEAQGGAAFESMSQVSKQIKEQAPLIEKSNDALEKRAGAMRKQASEADKLAKIEERRVEQMRAEGMRLTESLDPLVKRNNEIERYKTLLESGAISEGIYSHAVEKSTEDYLKALGFVEKEIESIDTSTKGLQTTSTRVFDSKEQIAIQGVRNIQSSFADGIFNFFDNGLKGGILEGGVADDEAGADAAAGGPGGESDPLYDEAVAIVIQHRKASISLVQRHLRIGYNRSARLLEQMEKAGLVSAMASNGNRDLLLPKRDE